MINVKHQPFDNIFSRKGSVNYNLIQSATSLTGYQAVGLLHQRVVLPDRHVTPCSQWSVSCETRTDYHKRESQVHLPAGHDRGDPRVTIGVERRSFFFQRSDATSSFRRVLEHRQQALCASNCVTADFFKQPLTFCTKRMRLTSGWEEEGLSCGHRNLAIASLELFTPTKFCTNV